MDTLSIYSLCMSHLCFQSPIGTIPQTISLVGLSIGNHDFTVNAPISDSSQIPQATIQFPSKLIMVCVIYRTVPISYSQTSQTIPRLSVLHLLRTLS